MHPTIQRSSSTLWSRSRSWAWLLTLLVTSPLLRAGECDPVPFQDILAPGTGDLGFGKIIAVSEDRVAVVSNTEGRVYALDGLTWELLGQPFAVPPSIHPNLSGAISGNRFVAGESSKVINGQLAAGAAYGVS